MIPRSAVILFVGALNDRMQVAWVATHEKASMDAMLPRLSSHFGTSINVHLVKRSRLSPSRQEVGCSIPDQTLTGVSISKIEGCQAPFQFWR